MSFPRYAKYKHSGVEWLGQVPEHWVVVRGRRLFYQKREPAFAHDEQLSATQKYGVVPQKVFMELEDQKVALALSGIDNFKHVEKDDFVISLRSFQGGIERSLHSGCVSPAYTVLRPTQAIHAGFWAYLLKSAGYIESLQTMTDGIRDGKTISYQQFGQIGLPLASVEEQVALATFLDRETAKIDALIAEQQRLIELLQEKRQAVISHAVTKGLNPDAPMKDSGIEWLGEVPEHWDVMSLKRLADIQTGVAKGKDNSGKATILVPYLRVANVQDGYLDLSEVTTIDIPVEELDRYALRAGDVLMNEGGDFDKLGRGCIWAGQLDPCISQNHVFAVRPRRVSSEWLNAITGSGYAQFYFMSRSKQSTNLASISSTNLMELPVILPPNEEQSGILAFMAGQTSLFASLTATATQAVSLLQERRSALISAAVTGQIDVRGLAGSEAA